MYLLVMIESKKRKMETSLINSTAMRFTKKTLFDETFIGPMRLKNRFIRASVGDHVPGGKVTEELLKRYETLAKGGVGTILTGFTLVDKGEKNMNILSMYDDTFMEGCEKLTDIVHRNDCNILMQLVSVGSSYTSRVAPDAEILGASAVENRRTGIIPREMTTEDIHNIVNKQHCVLNELDLMAWRFMLATVICFISSRLLIIIGDRMTMEGAERTVIA